MKRLTPSLLLLLAVLLILLDALWLHPRVVRGQTTLKVYVQQVKDKHWTDIQGTEIVGFACGPLGNGAVTECFVASR